MSSPYIGEIRPVGFNFAPVGWALCNGQLLPISQNAALFNLIGTTYGGDGQTTFALPNLQSRIPIHPGNAGNNTVVLGEVAGTESTQMTVGQMPAHSHLITATTEAALTDDPAGAVLASAEVYGEATTAGATLTAATVGSTGSSSPIPLIPPVLVVNYIISLFGIFPSQN